MNYIISGKVIKGDGYGKKLGYPTVNLASETKELPKEGVYSGTAALEGKSYRAGIVIGPGDKVEAHMLGYNGDAYDKIVTIEIGKFLRGYKKFNTEAELIIQIKKDLESC
ncbi:hypothetical protein A2823_02400 [Candidatus Nomurabacteria bacterium RIFCSPHIGHO2_01_FULL_41_91]|uniref:riboflavin kinase n=1 Tax=Candidatus Nomurabacteria bacterium RIFCSPLOWO2_12_FULL_41_10 TaxID=1801795 RepID=A0A1F6YAL2_9BACT|nr:MAG: hypothetical protein A2823_02400 [Candidatus Nomurabacteria bacterium RIFCSPHIGHO2_01_FULL_41_91]OGI80756.1 MAG: hypothetical protein A3D43_00565 [Candidatus Nomurabacteria bacterium RIFCSPHIGHO2_02_FULL_41_52]OGI84733.1 MAG: hypothetical protein A3F49_02680 [Candidatus Nomurabacteria bacterium RIFCSPHIGHO2_12_FULL_42_19]OGI93552.1 MAG: hypothetical protein A3A07_00960 [Candidatus Nomurabacteria bacterium RIFCSPLOWO2_01_FULL_41_52]OGI99716.1 MAG: hypothetical protein A3H56_01150 [Candid